MWGGRPTRREWIILIGVLALALIAWLLGPRLPLGEGYPFDGFWPRTWLALGVLGVGLLVLGIRRWRLRRMLLAQRAAAAEALGLAGLPGGGEMPAEEARLALAEALDWTRAREDRPERIGDGPYALPWALLAGAAGSGRSSLVAAADFAVPPQPRPAGGATYWLSEEAVLIEAPGAWFASGADAGPMQRLAARLRTERPRRPLDAALLAVTAEALLADPRATAAVLRARLQQLMRALGAAPPVLVGVTMCDRVPGFTAALGRQEGRGLALQFPMGGQGDPLPALRPALARFVAEAGRRLPHDLATERDAARRAALLTWPGEATRLAEAAEAFAAEFARVAPGDMRPDLRAIHLVAAGGAAMGPADPWAPSFTRGFALDRLPPPSRPEAPLFVDGLLRGQLLPLAGSGGRNRAEERRTTARHLGGYAACAMLLLAATVIWTFAFQRHEAVLSDLEGQIGTLGALERAAAAPQAAPGQMLAVLDEARRLTGLRAQDDAMDGILLAVMPRPRPALDAAGEVYDHTLRSTMLPFLRQQLEAQMTAETDLAQLRAELRLYLSTASQNHYDAAAFRAWGQATVAALWPLDQRARIAAQQHVARLSTLLPEPLGLNRAIIDQARQRLRQRPEADVIYQQLRQQAEGAVGAPPLDVVGSLGAAGAQMLMLRHQAGLPVVVPGFFTRAGFLGVFMPRLPGILQGDSDDAFVMGPDTNTTDRQVVAQRVTDLYTADYIRQWRAVLDQTALRALPDLTSLVGGMQALAGADSPLVAFVEMVRVNTDLQPPSDQAAGLLSRAAGAVGGQAAQQAVQGAATAAANAVPGVNPQTWPGTAIRVAFLPIITLAGGPGSPAAAARLQGPVATAFGTLSGIASGANPLQAAHQAAAAAIGPQANDPFSPIRTAAATLPRPLDGIFRDLHTNIWNVLLTMAMERISSTWRTDVAAVCATAMSRRYPFSGAGAPSDRDVLPKDFASFFGPNGTLDAWVTAYLLPFTQTAADGSLVPASRGGLRLDIARDGMAQVNRARAFRDLFFDSSGNLAVSLTLTPALLDARALSAVMVVGAQRMSYRHEPPRPFEFRWPGTDDGAAGASLQVAMTDGTLRQIDTGGPWALFRLLDRAERGTGTDRAGLRFRLGDVAVDYALRGASVTNPFTNRDWMDFRCIPRL